MFMRIGHSLFTLLRAFMGGDFSRRLYVQSRQTGNGDKFPTPTVRGT